MLVWVGCRFEEGCSFRSCWFGEGCWFGGCWFGEGCQLGRGAGLNDAGPGGDAGGERWGQGRGKNSGVHKDPPKPRGSAAALDRRVPPRGAAPCHNPRPKRPVIAAHGSPAFSTSVSPRNETAEKPTAEGERKRKYKKKNPQNPAPLGLASTQQPARPTCAETQRAHGTDGLSGNVSNNPSPHPTMNIPSSPRFPFQQC